MIDIKLIGYGTRPGVGYVEIYDASPGTTINRDPDIRIVIMKSPIIQDFASIEEVKDEKGLGGLLYDFDITWLPDISA